MSATLLSMFVMAVLSLLVILVRVAVRTFHRFLLLFLLLLLLLLLLLRRLFDVVECEVCGNSFDSGDASGEFGFACDECANDPDTYWESPDDDDDDDDD